MSTLSGSGEITIDGGVHEPPAITMGGSVVMLKLNLQGETSVSSAGTFSVDTDELTDQEILEMREAVSLYRSDDAELALHEDLVKELAGD